MDGTVVAITGASSGIGAATAVEPAGRGAAVVLGARRTDRLEELVGRIRPAGGRAEMRRVDVTRREDLTALVALAVDRFSPGYVRTELVDHVEDPEERERARQAMATLGIGPDAVARAIAFAVEQPADVEIGDITLRPTRQGRLGSADSAVLTLSAR